MFHITASSFNRDSSRRGFDHAPQKLRQAPPLSQAKPPADVAARIHALPRSDRGRGAELLHVTLAAFADLAVAPVGYLEMVMRGIDGFAAGAFAVQFDRIECRNATTLRSSLPLVGAWDFQRRLAEYFQRHGFTAFNLPTETHVTIDYRGDGRGAEAIAPVEWTVTEILLVESPTGAGRHIVHGRWPLAESRACEAA